MRMIALTFYNLSSVPQLKEMVAIGELLFSRRQCEFERSVEIERDPIPLASCL